jgi:hypothetical protein
MRHWAGGTILALAALAACSSNSIIASTAPCARDTDCGAGSYCERPLDQCAGEVGFVTAGAGHCHRSCWNGACDCASDEDCPGSRCSSGSCVGIGVDCAIESCTADCPQTRLAENACPICLCASCPGDAGPADGGPADGGQACGPTLECDGGSYCTQASGGAALPDAGANTWYTCVPVPSGCGAPPTCDCLMRQGCECSADGGWPYVTCEYP